MQNKYQRKNSDIFSDIKSGIKKMTCNIEKMSAKIFSNIKKVDMIPV